MAAIRNRNSSPARMRKRPLRWHTAISRLRASHCSYCATALSASSMQPWRSTMPGVTAFPSSSWAAPISTLPSVRQACRLFIPPRTFVRSYATSPNGTTSRCRCNISPSRYEPVALALNAELQEMTANDRARLTIPRYVPTTPPQGDLNAVREAARLLANAEHPVIVADKYARTADGVKLLVQLAEALQAPVIDQKGRMNFPNTHHLFQNGRAQALIKEADVILGLELSDYWGTVNGYIDNGENDGAGLQESHIKPNAKLIRISSITLNTKSNYQDFQRFQVVDVEMAGDAQATIPALIEAVKQALPANRAANVEARGAAMQKAWGEARDRTRQAASYAWDATPIST